MRDEELDALAEAARNATPGPWTREEVCGETHLRAANGVLVTRPSTAFARGDTPGRPDLRDCDKAYLEAANPATVLALIRWGRAAQDLLGKGTEVRRHRTIETMDPDQRLALLDEMARKRGRRGYLHTRFGPEREQVWQDAVAWIRHQATSREDE
jgi:hypothetical protein